ncbi:YobI family P-loop NTPase [Pedobacter paludis]|uniref:YobI family P-loop NTPase n=1 Tax=Pedobacter paludis TaxID=2203212 RepID=UPI0013148C19|nr:hypothetical protein [Pedobacter paludis]
MKIFKQIKNALTYLKFKLSCIIKRHGNFLLSISGSLIAQKADQKILYEDLSPNESADPDLVYQSAMKWALDNPNVRNIALTGPYGSGKSSIIKTFQKNNKKYEYLNISLASFKDSDPNPKVLELNILYQIFYYAKPSNIEQSRFGRIEIPSMGKIFIRVLGIVLLAVSIAFLTKAKYFESFPDIKSLQGNQMLIYTAWLIVITGLFSIIFWAFKGYHSFKVGKLNIASAEMELGKKDKSVLNEHLDEILYFFESSKYNVVFIEDLDRFTNPVEIFTKLREINLLINNANRVKRNVVFIYALKDELFKDEKRTKFFDFIIPVIPVINSNNAKDMLTRKLKKAGLFENIPGAFVSFISYYIDDMRMLLNIINELLLYKHILFKNSGLEIDKLLGMIVYKNLYPDDFSELHENAGKLHEIVQNKTTYLAHLVDKLKHEETVLNNKLAKASEERIGALRELREVFAFRLFDFVNTKGTHESTRAFTGSIEVDDTLYTLKDLVESEEIFERTMALENIKYQYQYAYNMTFANIKFTPQSLKKGDETYENRKELVAIRERQSQDSIRKELNQLRDQLSAHNEMDIKGIAKIIDLEATVPSLKELPVLSYLVRNGYLDENYSSYITLFHPGTLTIDDKDFLLAAQHRQSKPFNHPLQNLQELIDSLPQFAFARNYLLNFDLLDFLLLTKDNNAEQLDLLMNQMVSEKPKAIDFMLAYLESGRPLKAFLLESAAVFSIFWDIIDLRSGLEQAKKNKYFTILLQSLTTKEIASFDQQKSVTNFIICDLEFMPRTVQDNIIQEAMGLILHLDVKLKTIVCEMNMTDMVGQIYEHNLYELNVPNIALLMKLYLVDENYELLKNAHLTTILQSDCKPIKDYILKNLDTYVNQVFLNLSNNHEESSETILFLLNDEKYLTISEKKEIIALQKFKFVDDLKKIDTDLYPKLLDTLTITPSLSNVQEYWVQYGLDEHLVNYLNQAEIYNHLTGKWDSSASDFVLCFENIITSPEVLPESLKKILKTATLKFQNLDISALPVANVEVIISSGKMVMTPENFGFLQSRQKNETILLIEHFRRTFKKMMANFPLDTKDYRLILDSARLQDSEKILILTNIKPELLTESLANDALRLFMREPKGLTWGGLYAVISKSSIEREKMTFVNGYLSGATKDQIKKILIALGKPYANLVKSRGHAELITTDYHKRFAELLTANLKEGTFLSSTTPVKNKDKIRLNAKK